MKKYFIILFFFLLIQENFALDIPKLKGRVNDYSNTLSADEIAFLENKLKLFEDSTSNQVAVLLIESLEGEVLEDYSMKVVERWKLGQKENNNGVLLLLAMKDKKSRLEVGYGLEGVLTDALSGRILDEEIKPYFKDKKYFEGIDSATDKIIGATTGEYQKELAHKDEVSSLTVWILGILIVVGILGYFHWSLSFIGGGIGGGIILTSFAGLITLSLLPMIILGAIVGFLAHAILSLFFGGGVLRLEPGEGLLFAALSGDGSSGSSSGFSGGGGGFGGGGASGSW